MLTHISAVGYRGCQYAFMSTEHELNLAQDNMHIGMSNVVYPFYFASPLRGEKEHIQRPYACSLFSMHTVSDIYIFMHAVTCE